MNNNLEAGVLTAKSPKEVAEYKEKMKQSMLDTMRLFVDVFGTKKGQKVIDYLDKYSHRDFPNYDNVNATYSKIGEQAMVDVIKAMTKKGKEFG